MRRGRARRTVPTSSSFLARVAIATASAAMRVVAGGSLASVAGCDVGLSAGSTPNSGFYNASDGSSAAASDGGGLPDGTVLYPDSGGSSDSVRRGAVVCWGAPTSCYPDEAADAGASCRASAAPMADGDGAAATPGMTPALDASADASARVLANEADVGPAEAAAMEPDAGAAYDAAVARACHLVGTNVTTCLAAGAGAEGDACEGPSECGAGLECIADVAGTSGSGGEGHCARYCCDGETRCAGASGTPSFCALQTVYGADLLVPVCEPVSACVLLAPHACHDGQTCALVKDDGTASCVAVGSAGLGESCDEARCKAGLTCLGTTGARRCYELCLVTSATCTGGRSCVGSSQLFTNNQLGLCQ